MSAPSARRLVGLLALETVLGRPHLSLKIYWLRILDVDCVVRVDLDFGFRSVAILDAVFLNCANALLDSCDHILYFFGVSIERIHLVSVDAPMVINEHRPTISKFPWCLLLQRLRMIWVLLTLQGHFAHVERCHAGRSSGQALQLLRIRRFLVGALPNLEESIFKPRNHLFVHHLRHLIPCPEGNTFLLRRSFWQFW